MGLNERLAPNTNRSATFGSVATNSSARERIFSAPVAGEIVGARIVNGTTTSVVSGTTTGSAVSIVLYANASAAGSRIATYNGSGTTIATAAVQALLTSGASGTVNGRIASGSQVVAEFIGGAANNASNLGLFVEVDFMPGAYETGATAAAGTGPA
jgi:hypothetical protein